MKMEISHIFIGALVVYLGICMLLGWKSGLKTLKQLANRNVLASSTDCLKSKPLFIVTEPRGMMESKNSEEFLFAEVIKSQSIALSATLKLIRKR
jgi:hypothetical protein